MRLDDRPDDLERQAFGGRIHREHAPFGGPRFVGAEVDEFARLQLAAVEETTLSGDEQYVSFRDRAIEVWLAGPRHLDHPAVVTEHRLEDAKPLSCRNHTLGDHRADDGALHAWLDGG